MAKDISGQIDYLREIAGEYKNLTGNSPVPSATQFYQRFGHSLDAIADALADLSRDDKGEN
ncbi:hypothetical protein CKW39_08675 [Kocuria sp. WRN011]|uniref:hypothetical protein n=1 Tax=Kocuria sp. WRN011 TaxID=2029858 RepID=UPI000BAE7A16|nr:hypothetical protein [Kocuria sp. WRN011]PBB08430.1 hypothetical protein CKW39_08675 [Kocuria sp. WRN011]